MPRSIQLSRRLAALLVLACLELTSASSVAAGQHSTSTSTSASTSTSNTIRVAAAQAAGRVVDFKLKPTEALAAIEQNLTALEQIVERAGQEKCDALVLPEDTLGLLN
ncbi:MAG TPA: hypothetical protein VNU68_13945, partial [Verrucomicrobiae bacterium]|nr:hypothetical protein [Verrucomicrobiae bacterium]